MCASTSSCGKTAIVEHLRGKRLMLKENVTTFVTVTSRSPTNHRVAQLKRVGNGLKYFQTPDPPTRGIEYPFSGSIFPPRARGFKGRLQFEIMFPVLQDMLDLVPKLQTAETTLSAILLIVSVILLLDEIVFGPSNNFFGSFGSVFQGAVLAIFPPIPQPLSKLAHDLADKILVPLLPSKETVVLACLFLLPILSAFFILFLVIGPAKLAQTCKFLIHGVIFILLDLLPAWLLTLITTIVSITTLFVALGAYSVFLAHHSFRIFIDTLNETAYPFACFSALLSTTLLFGVIYSHREHRRDILARSTERLAAQKELTDSQAAIQRSAKQLSEVDASLVCLICVDRLTQPYTLAPCGHTFDLECLQGWFRAAHPSPADEELAETLDPRGALFTLRRRKFCPLCHGEVGKVCPAPARALFGLGLEMQLQMQAEEGSPWDGLFMKTQRTFL
ncbi:hypothetical protein C8R46DRAFT_1114271 [Mycena filopes]|nr:hypothetical protein C8R46DRAFT_1114271 [Mycena filopes]